MSARDALDRALLDLATEGRRPRCGEPDDHGLWVSDDHEDRARAARRCHGCPVLTECGAAADEERDVWTVRGGIDRRPSRTARAAKGATA